MNAPRVPFGPHLMLDFFCDSDRLNDRGWWRDLLERLVAEIGMTIRHGPIVVDSSCSNADWLPTDATGLTGFVVIAESHIAFHSFVEARYVMLDVSSCKPFESLKVVQFLERELGARDIIPQLAYRGLNFPRRDAQVSRAGDDTPQESPEETRPDDQSTRARSSAAPNRSDPTRDS